MIEKEDKKHLPFSVFLYLMRLFPLSFASFSTVLLKI